MKKFLGLAAILAAALVSCSKNENTPTKERKNVIIYASQKEMDTRAQLGYDGLTVTWEVGDRVGVYLREPYTVPRAQEDGWLDKNIFTVVSVDETTGKATLSGSLAWQPNTEYSFYAYTRVSDNTLTAEDMPNAWQVIRTLPSNQTNYIYGDGTQLYDFPVSSIMIASPVAVTTPATGDPVLDFKFHNMLVIYEMRIKLDPDYTGNDAPVIVSATVSEASGKRLQANQITCNITTGPSSPVLAEQGTEVWANVYNVNTDSYGYQLDSENPLILRTLMMPSDAEGYDFKITLNTVDNRTVTFVNRGGAYTPKPYLSGYRYWTEIPLDPALLHTIAGASQWDGTTKEPPRGNGTNSMSIDNAAQLAYVLDQIQSTNDISYGANVTITLNTDVDMNGAVWTGGSAQFAGTFDGRGNIIRNLVINGGNQANTGFFPRLPGAVISLHLRNVTVNTTGGTSCGGLAGYSATTGRIDNCSFGGTVNSASQYTGGIMGYFYSNGSATMHINGVKNLGNVTSTASAAVNPGTGGIIGYYYASGGGSQGADNNVVEDCYSTGTVSGDYGFVGGIVGIPGGGGGDDRTHYRNCYVNGPVTSANGTAGAFSGQAPGSKATITSIWRTSNVTASASTANTTLMSGTAWPAAPASGTSPNSGWIVGADSWGDLGGWNGGTPVYPKLWWEIYGENVELY